MNTTSFRFEYEEMNSERDRVQEIEIRFESTEDFDEMLKKRLNTFLTATGSSLKVS